MKYDDITEGRSQRRVAAVEQQGDISTEMEALEDNINSLTEEVNNLCLSISKILTPDNREENECADKPKQYECSLAQDLQRFNNAIYVVRDRVMSATRRVEL